MVNLTSKCFTQNCVAEGAFRITKNWRVDIAKKQTISKIQKNRKRPNELIKKAPQNMDKTISTKYQLAPEAIEKRSLNPNDGKYFQEICDFMRIKIIRNNQMRNAKYDPKIDKRKK